ncbi:MAG: hypothetical protein KatS3mg131_2417 [Candidatus Tectimicrobiota bacterium]|nr:MAG: hypothetical protein KatS3mg131_2417 [Candidatus Tectomicrobia bacterium]
MRTTTALRRLLQQPGIVVAPGAYDCLTAKLIEREGFPAVYLTGAGTAVTRLGKPDFGFTTLTEMAAAASAVAATVAIPVIADAVTVQVGQRIMPLPAGMPRSSAGSKEGAASPRNAASHAAW